MAQQTWNAAGYARHAAFVPALGKAVVDLLNPRPGERILDIGCGDGTLTEQIAARGASVIGVDISPDLAAAARARGIDVRMINAEALAFDEEFDAVFSNAALHWMREQDAVVAGVHRALKPGGRFVAECGGHGNIAAIMVAIRAVLIRRGAPLEDGRYYATDRAARQRLERHGFEVLSIALIPRPTPLPTGMAGWLDTFAKPQLSVLPESQRAEAAREIEELLRPALCDERGLWTADYVRLRFAARKR